VICFLPTVITLCGIIRRYQIEIVHTNSLHSWYGCFAAAITRTPHVWHVREIVTQSRTIRAIELFLAKKLSNRIVTMSDAIRNMFKSNSAIPAKVTRIYEGTDLTRFSSAFDAKKVREELGIEQSDPLFGIVSRLDPWKGIDVFIRAAERVLKEYPRAKFIVSGGEIKGHEGYAETLKDLVGKLGLEKALFFVGWRYMVDDVAELIAGLDVLVSASVEPEPFGLSIIEAMACGKPVIASNQGGPQEIVLEGVTGHLTSPGNEEELARRMISLLSEPEKATQMGLAGRKRAEELFDWKKNILLMDSVYREILTPLTPRP